MDITNEIISTAFISGIYVIINRSNNRFYIGESLNIVRRKKEHFNLLTANKHYNKELQSDYIKYGDSSFEFKILLPHVNLYGPLYTEVDLLILENEFINHYSNLGFNLYNKEKTLEDLLTFNNKRANGKKNTMYYMRTLIVGELLNNDVEWSTSDDIPRLIPLPTLFNIFGISLPNKKLKRLVNKLPENFHDLYQIKTINFINNPSGKEIINSTLIIDDVKQFSDWLYNNKYISKDKYYAVTGIKEKLSNGNNSLYKIPQTKLYEELKDKDIIDIPNFSYTSFKEMLFNNQIYNKDSNGKYIPSEEAINKGYISEYNNSTHAIWFSALGKDIVSEITEKYMILLKSELN